MRLAEQRFGRAMTSDDFEILTLASARNAQKGDRDRLCRRATRRVPDFARPRHVLRGLRCAAVARRSVSPPLRIGELKFDVGGILSHIAPILRRYMPATAMFNVSGQPAMSVPLYWNAAGLPIGVQFVARFADDAFVSVGGATGAGTPLEGQIASSLRVN